MNTFGFIGCGNMGGTLAVAVSKSVGDKIAVADFDRTKIENILKQTGANARTNTEIAAECKYIFLGVKPQILPSLIEEIAPVLKKRTDRFVLVSMAAGVKIEKITKLLGNEYPIIRIMPNTPAAVGKGLIVHCGNSLVTDEETAEFEKALSAAGAVDPIPESLIDAACAISGCGPAFVYIFTEALADGGVRCGLPRDKALRYAAQTVLGSAQMVLDTGRHPGELKDAVCSPGGSTIAGVEALEDAAFRGAAMRAVIEAFEKTKELGKE